MKYLFIYRIWDIENSDSNADELKDEIWKQISVCSWIRPFNRSKEGSFVLLAYEMDKPVDPDEHFKQIVDNIGPLSDKTGRKLAIEMFGGIRGTMTAPDSRKDKCSGCPDCPAGCADCDEDSTATEDGKKEEDEWADVLRLRDLSKH